MTESLIYKNDRTIILLAFFREELSHNQRDKHELHIDRRWVLCHQFKCFHNCSKYSQVILLIRMINLLNLKIQASLVLLDIIILCTKKTELLHDNRGICWKFQTNYWHNQNKICVYILIDISFLFVKGIFHIDFLQVLLVSLSAFFEQELILLQIIVFLFNSYLKLFLEYLLVLILSWLHSVRMERLMMYEAYLSLIWWIRCRKFFLSFAYQECCSDSFQIFC